jgi:hypothetical protein
MWGAGDWSYRETQQESVNVRLMQADVLIALSELSKDKSCLLLLERARHEALHRHFATLKLATLSLGCDTVVFFLLNAPPR